MASTCATLDLANSTDPTYSPACTPFLPHRVRCVAPAGNGVVVSVPGINGANLNPNGHAIGTESGGRWAGMRQLWMGLGSAFEVITVEAVEVSLDSSFPAMVRC